MKDKILFWLDVGLTQFAISTFLPKEHDCEMFAIIDSNIYLKKFFSSQKLSTFSKTYYYRDSVYEVKEDIDFEYLQEFENKYKINLWNIIYSDRYFFNNPYYQYTSTEILSITEQASKFFEKILDEVKPDFLILRTTDYFQNQLLHELCLARNIHVLTLSHSRLGFRAIISQNTDHLDDLSGYDSVQVEKTRDFNELRKHVYSYREQSKAISSKDRSSLSLRLKTGLRFLFVVCNNRYRNYYAHFGRTRLRVLRIEGLFLLRRLKRKKFIDNNFEQKLPTDTPFVYYPLHVEPERSLSVSAPFYTNQLEVILHIAKSTPASHQIFVKEHPDQETQGWRDVSFYKQILALPNVKLVHPDISNFEMMENCSLVVSIAGTSAMEAAFFNKHAIVFADAIYSKLESIHKLTSLEALPKMVREYLDCQTSLDDLNRYVQFLESNSFSYDIGQMTALFYDQFFYGGFIRDIEIDENIMKGFLEKHKEKFTKLTTQHVNKIKQLSVQKP